MARRKVLICNKKGLHARAASRLVQVASAFSAEVRLLFNDKQADGKNIMSVMMLAAAMGTEVVLEAEGEDAEAALDALVELIESRFDEGE
ncbi:MAG: HPr family phosphocarrier protein [Gammaproteobacteria bacterium]|nr:HPr family phosphocarrier protein [Gammaproteobacteria bacterium]